jgi:hypothetical protein
MCGQVDVLGKRRALSSANDIIFLGLFISGPRGLIAKNSPRDQ